MSQIELNDDEAFFKKDKAGREVIQWRVSAQFPVKVGDDVILCGRTARIEAIGNEFNVFERGKAKKHRYLYTQIPVRSERPLTAKSDAKDDDVAQFEAEQNRGLRNDEIDAN